VRHDILNELAHRRMSLKLAIAIVDRLCGEALKAQTNIESYSKSETLLPTAGQAPSPDEMVALSERWLWRSACQIAGHTYSELIVAITATKDRLEQRYGALRRCVDGLTSALDTQCAPQWEAMSENWQLRAEAALRRLNGRSATSMLIAPILQRDYDASNGTLVQLLEDATLIAKSMKLAEQDAIASGAEICSIISESGIPQWREVTSNDTTAAPATNPTNAFSNNAIADSQPAKDANAADVLSGNKGDSLDYCEIAEAAIKSVRPQLLDCGGSQRMLLLIGNEADRKRWEPVVRQAHSGSLTTILVAGMAPTLVCEAQKIKLSDVRSRMISTLGGREDVLGRLHSRCDVVWS
jgi:hypothetical protein